MQYLQTAIKKQGTFQFRQLAQPAWSLNIESLYHFEYQPIDSYVLLNSVATSLRNRVVVEQEEMKASRCYKCYIYLLHSKWLF